MRYDPIKRSLGKVFNASPLFRKIFYRMLDLLLLRTWHVKREFKKWAKGMDKANILDAGMGFGQYSFFMAKMNKNFQVKGVDVKEEQIEDCNNFFNKVGMSNAHFEFADLVKLNENDKYDFILSVDVMEHILEDVEVFKNFNKALRNNGMLLISTPSDQGGSDADHHEHEHESDGISGFIDEHVRDGYGIDDITEKLNKAGFSKVDAWYSYGKPGQISWKLSMKYPIQMLNVSKLFFIILPFYYLITFPFALILNSMDLNRKHKTGTGLIVKAYK